MTTDNAANMVLATKILLGTNGHISCFAHTLNLICQGALENTEELKNLIGNVRAIVTAFKQSSKATALLICSQKNESNRTPKKT